MRLETSKRCARPRAPAWEQMASEFTDGVKDVSNLERRQACSSRSGFTMVEIAICLGIIAFALVAIIGVLPSGMKVQKENREETIINQDGLYFLEAIRSGSKGIDELTNYVESITVVYGRNPVVFTNAPIAAPNRLTNAQQIIGLLSTPKYERLPNGAIRTNIVEARVRAISGVAAEKSPLNNELAFRYILRSEIVPSVTRPPGWRSGLPNDAAFATNLLQNLHDVRLTMRWPLFLRGTTWDTGRGRKTFRTLVSGEMRAVTPPRSPFSYYWFDPNRFTSNSLPVL